MIDIDVSWWTFWIQSNCQGEIMPNAYIVYPCWANGFLDVPWDQLSSEFDLKLRQVTNPSTLDYQYYIPLSQKNNLRVQYYPGVYGGGILSIFAESREVTDSAVRLFYTIVDISRPEPMSAMWNFVGRPDLPRVGHFDVRADWKLCTPILPRAIPRPLDVSFTLESTATERTVLAVSSRKEFSLSIPKSNIQTILAGFGYCHSESIFRQDMCDKSLEMLRNLNSNQFYQIVCEIDGKQEVEFDFAVSLYIIHYLKLINRTKQFCGHAVGLYKHSFSFLSFFKKQT